MDKQNFCYNPQNCVTQDYSIPTKINNNYCNCFPYSPISPLQIQWSKICDYFGIGDPAPAFTLEGVLYGELVKINLNQYLGKWVVLFFYNGDFTFV